MRMLLPSAIFTILAFPVSAQSYWPSESDIVTPTALGLSVATENGQPAAELPFGTGFQDTMHGLIAILGWNVAVGFPQECGAGPLVSADFPGDITLMFQNDRFVGWFMDAGDLLVTDSGLRHAAPTSILTTTGTPEFFESSLGTEFETAGLYGLLSDDGARIDAIWTGTNCIFR